MTARKADRARAPLPPRRRASASSRSVRLRSVMSVKVRTALPSGRKLVRTSSTVPLGRVPFVEGSAGSSPPPRTMVSTRGLSSRFGINASDRCCHCIKASKSAPAVM